MGEFLIPDGPMLPPAPPPDPMVAREEKIADDTRVEQALNQFLTAKQGALFDAPDAFYRTQGEDAIHAAPVVTKNLDQLRSDLVDGLGNDYQRQRLGNALDAQMRLTRDGMARHVAEQSLAWQRGVAQDRIALLTKEAAQHHNDTDLVDALGHAAATAARAHSRVGDGPPGGEAEDAAAATARSGVLGAAIQARLDGGDTTGANALLTQVQDQLDPAHAAPLQGQIDNVQRLVAAKDYVGQLVPAWSNASHEEVDAQHAAATQQNQADNAGDSELQTDVQHVLDVQHGLQKRGLDQAATQKPNQAVQEWLSKTGPGGEPQTERPPAAIWNTLGPEERAAVDQHLKANAQGEAADAGSTGHFEVIPGPSSIGWVPEASPQQPPTEQPPSQQPQDQAPNPPQQDEPDDAEIGSSRGEVDLPSAVPTVTVANNGEILSDASPEPITDGQRYAQNAGPPPRRLGSGGRDLTPREATRWDFFNLHRAELERLEPGNSRLSYAAPPGWVPSQRNVDEMAREAANARARAVPGSRPREAAKSSSGSDLSASDLVRGSVPNGIQSRTADFQSGAPVKLSRSEQAIVNFRAGREYEEDSNRELQRDKLEVGPQLTLETPSGRQTRIDFVTRHPTSGEIRCIECKASETAPLTRNQREAFPEIGTAGATVKGAGKPGFPGGTYIPPTNVEIMRKR